MAIREFVVDRRVKLFYSDASGEIKKASKLLRISHERSQPGVPQNNGIIERANQDIIVGTIASLVHAGLPPCFWSFAASCYCMLDNTNDSKGPSPWALTHRSEFEGLRIPFREQGDVSAGQNEASRPWNVGSSHKYGRVRGVCRQTGLPLDG